MRYSVKQASPFALQKFSALKQLSIKKLIRLLDKLHEAQIGITQKNYVFLKIHPECFSRY